jgi:hypothetical protein
VNRRADMDSGISSLVHGSEQDARELRANLAAFARRSDDPNLRKLVSNVLAGRRNVREIFRAPEFIEAAGTHLDRIEQGLSSLTDEERARVWDQTRARTDPATLTRMRYAHDPGGPLLPREDDDEPAQPILKRRR